MKAIGYYERKKSFETDYLIDLNLPELEPGPNDLLIEVKAVSVNPVDYKIRQARLGAKDVPVVLGWDAVGIVLKSGRNVKNINIGDEVFYAGDLTKQGSNAEKQLVDYRIVGAKPKNISYAQAASLPLTSLTAYEGLFEKLQVPTEKEFSILFIGGAGGVNSIGIQLVKALTKGRVFVTSGSSESEKWLSDLLVDGIINRNIPFSESMKRFDLKQFDYVFSTSHTDQYLDQLPNIISPFGSLCLIDDPASFEITKFKSRSISVHWELMFTKTLFQHDLESQGKILDIISKLVEEEKIKST